MASGLENMNIDEFVDAEEIFFELASQQRLSIIFGLYQKKAKLSELSKDLGITMQEVHRNVNRLQDAGLIEKDSDGIFSLTTFGNTIIKQIPSFDFLSQHKEYFSEHTLGELPMKFVQRIGALNNCELVRGIVTILEFWKQIYRESESYIFEIIPQVPLDLIEPILFNVRDRGIRLCYIFPRDVIIPKGRTELLKRLGFDELYNTGRIGRRMVDKVQVAAVINEKKASVLFPTQKGETDMNLMFYSEDQLFHDWCLDYFWFRWYGSESFEEDKLREI
ncbi:MAG TPA: transcriptional regulator [Nitrososphaeraceae archaeon]|nr:transcriptional regulator [Nitrososphaeraceae archaeon]